MRSQIVKRSSKSFLKRLYLSFAVVSIGVVGCGESYELKGTFVDLDGNAIEADSAVLQFVETQEEFEPDVLNDEFVFKSLPQSGTFVISAYSEERPSIGHYSSAITSCGLLEEETVEIVLRPAGLAGSDTGEPIAGLEGWTGTGDVFVVTDDMKDAPADGGFANESAGFDDSFDLSDSDHSEVCEEELEQPEDSPEAWWENL